MAAAAFGGAAAASPPGAGGPLSEGREPDPVVRDHYLPTPTGEPARGREPAPPPKPGGPFGGFLAALGEALLRGLSIPLGTARVDDPR